VYFFKSGVDLGPQLALSKIRFVPQAHARSQKGEFVMPTPIESHLLDYQGEFTKTEVFEQAPALVANVIETTQKWGVTLEWEMKGMEARRGHGHWKVFVFLESMGPAKEYKLPTAGPVVILNNEGTWDAANSKRIFATIPGKLPVEFDPATEPIDPGTYWLTATIQYYDDMDVPFGVSGFYEGPMLEFYDPGI
jgi:hypothetical protein